MVIVFQQVEESEPTGKNNKTHIERETYKFFRRINWMKEESTENDQGTHTHMHGRSRRHQKQTQHEQRLLSAHKHIHK